MGAYMSTVGYPEIWKREQTLFCASHSTEPKWTPNAKEAASSNFGVRALQCGHPLITKWSMNDATRFNELNSHETNGNVDVSVHTFGEELQHPYTLGCQFIKVVGSQSVNHTWLQSSDNDILIIRFVHLPSTKKKS
jgi:hypothetical protein